jgi:hypothetical protein
LTDIKESQEQEITSLFEDARVKLAKVDENAKDLKKNIVIELAKKLEGKIPQTDSISIEIVNQLRGQVSERFIHECLPENTRKDIGLRMPKNKRNNRKMKTR